MGKYDRRSFLDRTYRRMFSHLKQVAYRMRPAAVQQSVFVAGMQRSGTNLLMEVLECSQETDVYHETDARAFVQYQLKSVATLHELIQQSGAPFWVIKTLCDLDRLPSLLDDFMPAKAIWMWRDYPAVVRSATASFSGFAPRMERLCTDRRAEGWYGRGMSDATHAQLCALYRPGISEASAAAFMWYFRNILYFEMGLDRDERVILLRYEDFVNDAATQMNRIGAHLGLSWTPGMIRRIKPVPAMPRVVPDIDASIQNCCDSLTQRFVQASLHQPQGPTA